MVLFTPFTILSNFIISVTIITMLNIVLYFISYETIFSPKFLLVIVILPIIRLFLPLEFKYTFIIRSEIIYPRLINFFVYSIDTSIFKITIAHLMLCVFIFGFTYKLIHELYIYRKLYRFVYSMPYNQNHMLLQFLNDELEKKGFKKNSIRIVTTNHMQEPMLIGILNPIIVVPTNLNANQAKDIILHEMAHYIYGDLFIKLVIGIISYVFWWLLPMRLLKCKIDYLLEIRADHLVIQNKTQQEKDNYLYTLVNISENKNAHKIYRDYPFPAMFSLVDKKSLVRRVKAVQNRERDRSSYKILLQKTTVLLLFFICMLLPFGVVIQPFYNNNTPETYAINDDNCYLVIREDGLYELYIDGVYCGYMSEIDEQLQIMPIKEGRKYED